MTKQSHLATPVPWECIALAVVGLGLWVVAEVWF